MLRESVELVARRLEPSDQLLDVGGWYAPFARADWVIDLMPHATRGPSSAPGAERFTADTWVERDICDREPWPFADDQFDFAICSHTLEDVRDPVWVCAELNRVARAGYLEVPSRLQEQAWGVNGEWVGWSHHRWLIDVGTDSLEFVFKPHVIHARPAYQLPAPLGSALNERERVQILFWDGGFGYRERIFYDHAEFDGYLSSLVKDRREELESSLPRASRRRRLGGALAARRRGR